MPKPLRISSTSLEYIRSKVTAEENGVAVDPTSYAVSFAFATVGEDPITFYSGTWEQDGTEYYARCLVGPAGTATLTDGRYDVYVKIQAGTEIPVKYVGLLVVE
jgi:hypothetical protein